MTHTTPNASPRPDTVISLGAIIDNISTLLNKTVYSNNKPADRQHLLQARVLLQSWATIKGLRRETSFEHLYLKAPGLRGHADFGEGKTHGEYVWTTLEIWLLETNKAGCNLDGKAESLLRTVQYLYEKSPLPPEFDPFNSKQREISIFSLIPGYCSGLQAVNLGDSNKTNRTGNQPYTKIQDKPVQLSPTRFSKGSNEKHPKGEPYDTEIDANSNDLEWNSIIGMIYQANLHTMLVIQPLLEEEEKQKFERSIGRFRVWGCSLFPQTLSLDVILSSSQESIKGLRTYVIGTLGDISLTEIRLLHSLAKPHDTIARMALLRLQSCFGRSEELNSAVLELPDSFYDSIRQAEETTLTTILGDQMVALIDCLFDIMPAISRVRHVYLLNLERVPEKPKPPQNIIVNSLPSSAEASTSSVIQSSKYSQHLYPSYETSGYRSSTSGGKAVLAPPYGPHDPMLEMLTMNLELAEAMKESLASSQSSEKAQSSNDRATMKQIMKWEKEITHLRDWSRAFEKSLSASATPVEIEARIDAFGRLVNIGCVFASAIPKQIDPKSPLAGLTSTEQKIKRMVAAMPSSYTIDVKIDHSGKTLSDALNALSKTNKALPTL